MIQDLKEEIKSYSRIFNIPIWFVENIANSIKLSKNNPLSESGQIPAIMINYASKKQEIDQRVEDAKHFCLQMRTSVQQFDAECSEARDNHSEKYGIEFPPIFETQEGEYCMQYALVNCLQELNIVTKDLCDAYAEKAALFCCESNIVNGEIDENFFNQNLKMFRNPSSGNYDWSIAQSILKELKIEYEYCSKEDLLAFLPVIMKNDSQIGFICNKESSSIHNLSAGHYVSLPKYKNCSFYIDSIDTG